MRVSEHPSCQAPPPLGIQERGQACLREAGITDLCPSYPRSSWQADLQKETGGYLWGWHGGLPGGGGIEVKQLKLLEWDFLVGGISCATPVVAEGPRCGFCRELRVWGGCEPQGTCLGACGYPECLGAGPLPWDKPHCGPGAQG